MKPYNLFSPVQLGDLTLKNRIFMAPLTRTRVLDRGIISPLAAIYYAQRASAGLIVTETIVIAPGGEGRALMPGLYVEEQVIAWQKVTEAVHAKEGRIFAQLGHSGRVSLPDFNNGLLPIAPSAIEFVATVYRADGELVQPPIPRALLSSEIACLVLHYKQAAINAKKAGFDGVELNGGNAGLVEQFLHPVSNTRTDKYGGSLENRARFLLEILDTFIEVFGKDRVGLFLSPHDRLSNQFDPEPVETNVYLARQCAMRDIAYLHLLEPAIRDDAFTPFPQENPNIIYYIREYFARLLIINGNYTRDSGNKAIEHGEADAVSYGRAFIANPDLPERFKHDFPLHQADPVTFYGAGPKGYIDYLPLNQLLD